MRKILFIVLAIVCCTVISSCNKLEDEKVFSSKDKIPNMEEAYPNFSKEIITLANGIQIEKLDSIFILGKDIVLTKAQVDSLNKPSSRAAVLDEWSKTWKKGIVFYKIQPTNNAEFRRKIENAIAHWEAKTNVRFWEIEDYVKDYVEFIPGEGNWSMLGRIGGVQHISLYPDYRSNTGSAIHEIGHTMGLFHEQSRVDRDNYISINWNNISPAYKSAYQTYAQSGYKGQDYGPFDFGSIMLYSSKNSFAIDPAIPTMTKKDGSTFIGQRQSLSEGDIAAIKYHYPKAYENELLYFRKGGRVEVLTMGGRPYGSETYGEYLFLTKRPATTDITITLEISFYETSRDYEPTYWTHINTVTIPAGSRYATFEFQENYNWADDYGWTNVDATITADLIPEIYN